MALKRLVEKFTDWPMSKEDIQAIPLKLTESTNTVKLKESKYPVLGAYKIPIWRISENGKPVANRNKRYYSRALAEKVIRENKVTPVLDGHPQDDDYIPVVNDIIAIAKNPTLEIINGNEIMFAEVYFVNEEFSKKVVRSLDLGLSLEQSSSGLGDFLEDGCTVDPDSYFLERYLDVLLNSSSFEVSFGKQNEIDLQTEYTEKAIDNTSKSDLNENITIDTIETNKLTEIEENTMKNDKVTIPVSMIRKDISRYFQEAETKIDLNERLEAFTEIKNWVDETKAEELKDILENANKEIASILEKKEELSIKGVKTDSLEEQVAVLTKSLEEKVELSTSLEENYSKACVMLDEVKVSNNKYKEITELQAGKMNAMVEADDFIKLTKEIDALKESKLKVVESLADMKVQMKSFVEKHNSYVDKIKQAKLDEQVVLDDIKKANLIETKKLEAIANQEAQIANDLRLEEEAKKEANLDIITQRSEVRAYYNSLVEKYSPVVMEQFKESIMSCRTVSDATIRHFKIRESIEELQDEIDAVKSKELFENLATSKRLKYTPKDNQSRWL